MADFFAAFIGTGSASEKAGGPSAAFVTRFALVLGGGSASSATASASWTIGSSLNVEVLARLDVVVVVDFTGAFFPSASASPFFLVVVRGFLAGVVFASSAIDVFAEALVVALRTVFLVTDGGSAASLMMTTASSATAPFDLVARFLTDSAMYKSLLPPEASDCL